MNPNALRFSSPLVDIIVGLVGAHVPAMNLAKHLFVAAVVALTLSAFSVVRAGVPITDFVVYGRVYTAVSHSLITDSLPGAITVKINSATGPSDPVIGSTNELRELPGNATKEYFVLRLRRYEAGTPRGASDTFVLPGDRIRIYLNGAEVTETMIASVLVTSATQDVRRLNLNSPAPDTDDDGLPDSWEQLYFGGIGGQAGDDTNKDGVSALMAFAAGLNPGQNNASKMPFLSMEQGGALVFYFRMTTEANLLDYFVQASDTLGGSTWGDLPGLVPQVVSTEGASRLVKVVIPGGKDRPSRFFRLNVSPQP